MKVSLCSQCRITPEITFNEIKCPKCNRMACGKDLTESVTRWNNEEFSTPGKVAKVVVKDEETIKAEVKAEIEAEKPEKAKKSEEKPVRKPVKKPVKKGAK